MVERAREELHADDAKHLRGGEESRAQPQECGQRPWTVSRVGTAAQNSVRLWMGTAAQNGVRAVRAHSRSVGRKRHGRGELRRASDGRARLWRGRWTGARLHS
eukprot:2426328-Prymnesium_polylepis.1